MFLTNLNKRIQAVATIVALAIAAVVGLLLLMNWLASSETPAADHNNVAQQPTAVAPDQDDSDSIIATVNDEVITKQAWQQATHLDAVMSRLAAQAIPTAEETLDRLINEIIVLEGVGEIPSPTPVEIEARILTLETKWNVADEVVVSPWRRPG